ncbi:YueH family protein [Cytobacillus kochii]|uniref:YueH family protein n=1 Tax=Cytobacillus kochii TaxID=859143 RepID=UPI00384CC5F9
MKYLQEKMHLLGERHSNVYIIKTPEEKYIVSIPDLHWSAQIGCLEEFQQKVEYLNDSLSFHLYEGNSYELAYRLSKLTELNRFR